jgi:hypothetical protein
MQSAAAMLEHRVQGISTNTPGRVEGSIEDPHPFRLPKARRGNLEDLLLVYSELEEEED